MYSSSAERGAYRLQSKAAWAGCHLVISYTIGRVEGVLFNVLTNREGRDYAA